MPEVPRPLEPVSYAADRPLAGMAWMMAAGLSFVCFVAAVKTVGSSIPVIEGAFLRFAFGYVFLIPLWGQIRRHWPRGKDLKLFVIRGLIHTAAILAWFYAMTRIPIAEVTAINYLAPICVTIGAALFLGERLAARRIAAVVVGLIGAIVILRPGFRTLEPGHFSMIFAALCMGASYVIGKSLAGRFPATVVVAWLALTVTPILLPMTVAVWVAPSLTTILLMAVAALFANAGHYMMTRAFSAAPVAVTQPVTFLQLVWSVLLGAFVFHEPIDLYVLLGGLIIVGAVSFIAWREAQLKKHSA